jgi:parallel beta-helix repeat protein
MRFVWGFLAAVLFGIFMTGMVQAAVLECDSCDSCNAQIAAAADGDTVQLNTSISNYAGTCISFGGKDNVTFDCLGNEIGGDSSGSGIWLNDSDGGSVNSTVTNCTIAGFHYGVYINSSSGNLFYNNLFNNSFNLNSSDSQNWWNTTQSVGSNIAGGPSIGGNYWADPSGNGFSQICTDSDSNLICDSAYALDSNNSDYLALTKDMTPPSIAFVPPTPLNGTQLNQSWIFINASASEPLGSCILDWNGSNETFAPSGAFCAVNKTSLSEGTYAFRMYANDSSGNWNSTEARQAMVNLSVNLSAPSISDYISISYGINPALVRTDTNTTVSFNVTTNGTLDSIVVRITLPNSALVSFVFSGNATFSYTPPLWGIYNLTIFANTTAGYNQSVSGNFTAADCMENETMECGTSIGECRKGNITCNNGAWGSTCEGAIGPQNETCNGKDDNCNGIIDDNAGCCNNGDTRSCGIDTGVCEFGISTCSGAVWGACIGGIGSVSEICGNNLDDNCDGQTDENCATCIDLDDDGYGSPASNTCQYPELDCNDSDRNVNPGMQEVCDGKDNNCDGQADEGGVCNTCSDGIMDGKETGVDCGGDCASCADYSIIWISISVIGALIFGVLLFMYFKLKRQGRELSWEELMKKWTPGQKGYVPR